MKPKKETVVVRFNYFEYLPDGDKWKEDFDGKPKTGEYYLALKETFKANKKEISRWKICLAGKTMPGIMVHSLDDIASDTCFRYSAEEMSIEEAKEMMTSSELSDNDFENLASILTDIRERGNWLEDFDEKNSRVLEMEEISKDILPQIQSLILSVIAFGPKSEEKSEKSEEKSGNEVDHDKKFGTFEKRPYYNNHPSGVECIDVIEHMNFNLGSAVKYIWRAGEKSPDIISDLSKAAYYINREIERIKKEKK